LTCYIQFKFVCSFLKELGESMSERLGGTLNGSAPQRGTVLSVRIRRGIVVHYSAIEMDGYKRLREGQRWSFQSKKPQKEKTSSEM
jgi:cold shock CspA family protein